MGVPGTGGSRGSGDSHYDGVPGTATTYGGFRGRGVPGTATTYEDGPAEETEGRKVVAVPGIPAMTASRTITWEATDLSGMHSSSNSITIRKGDSLLLTASDGNKIDADGDGTFELTGGLGAEYPVMYDAPGEVIVTAKHGSNVVGSLLVIVVDVDLTSPIACQVGYRREKDVAITLPAYASQVGFAAAEPHLLDVSVKELTATGATLYLKPHHRGTPVVVARLGGATGPIIATKEIDEFTIWTTAQYAIAAIRQGCCGATAIGKATITMDPRVTDLTARMTMYSPGSTFEGGLAAIEFSTTDFVLEADGSGTYQYDIWLAPEFQNLCHDLTVVQEESPGETISITRGINGCVVTVTCPDCVARTQGGASVTLAVEESEATGCEYHIDLGLADAGTPCWEYMLVHDWHVDQCQMKAYNVTLKNDMPGADEVLRGKLYFSDTSFPVACCDIDIVDVNFSEPEARPGPLEATGHNQEIVDVTNNTDQTVTLKISKPVKAKLNGDQDQVDVAAGATFTLEVNGKVLSDADQDTMVEVIVGGETCGGMPVTVVRPKFFTESSGEDRNGRKLAIPGQPDLWKVQYQVNVAITVIDDWKKALRPLWATAQVQEFITSRYGEPPEESTPGWEAFPPPSTLSASGVVTDPVGFYHPPFDGPPLFGGGYTGTVAQQYLDDILHLPYSPLEVDQYLKVKKDGGWWVLGSVAERDIDGGWVPDEDENMIGVYNFAYDTEDVGP